MSDIDQPVSFTVDLAGRTAIVTGAASGIGKATALRLLGSGASVLATDVNAAGLAALAEESGPLPGTCRTFQAQLLDVQGPRSIVEASVTAFGERIDIVVNCAGIYESSAIEDVTGESFERIININLRTPVLLVAAARPHLVAGSAVVLIASGTAVGPTAYQGVYAASKAGVATLASSLAAELAPDGIRVNAVSPGFTDTPMIKDAVADPAMSEAIIAMTPDRLIGTPQHLADAVLFLASRGAEHIHGINLPVDGGFSQVSATPPIRVDE